MLEPTKKPLTDIRGIEFLHVICPQNVYLKVNEYLEAQGCTVERSVAAEEVCDFSPSNCLKGARYKENMTQAELAARTGISRRHISEMENNKRPIGKGTAKKLAEALNISYKVFL